MEEYLKRVEWRNVMHAKQRKRVSNGQTEAAVQESWPQRRFWCNSVNLDTHFYGSGYVITNTHTCTLDSVTLGLTEYTIKLEIQHFASPSSDYDIDLFSSKLDLPAHCRGDMLAVGLLHHFEFKQNCIHSLDSLSLNSVRDLLLWTIHKEISWGNTTAAKQKGFYNDKTAIFLHPAYSFHAIDQMNKSAQLLIKNEVEKAIC